MKAMVLAAGLGTRLGALTRELPKPLLPLAGEPLIAHTLRYLGRFGFHDIMINLHFCPAQVINALGDGRRLGVRLSYSHEPVLLGTAGGVRNALGFFEGEAEFLVVYGDLLVDQDLEAMLTAHRARGAAATLLVHRRAQSNSAIALDEIGRVVRFLERPTDEERRALAEPWVNSGVQILTPGLLSHLELGRHADLPRDVYVPLVATRPIYGFSLTGFRVAIDSPTRYEEAQRAVSSGAYTTTEQAGRP